MIYSSGQPADLFSYTRFFFFTWCFPNFKSHRASIECSSWDHSPMWKTSQRGIPPWLKLLCFWRKAPLLDMNWPLQQTHVFAIWGPKPTFALTRDLSLFETLVSNFPPSPLYLIYFSFYTLLLIFPQLSLLVSVCLSLRFWGFCPLPCCQTGFPADEASEEEEEEQLQRERNTDSHQGDPQEEGRVVLQTAGVDLFFFFFFFFFFFC